MSGISERAGQRLLLMRHATADYAFGTLDHERPLIERGVEQSRNGGRFLKERSLAPDVILCSTALRSRQTCTWVRRELGDDAPTPKLEDVLYDASSHQVLALINHTPQMVRTLLVISHLPVLRGLGLFLAGRESDAHAYRDFAEHFVAGSLAIFSVPCDWETLDAQDAVLQHVQFFVH